MMFKKSVNILIFYTSILCVSIGNCFELEPKTFIEYGNTLALRSEFKLAAEEYFRSFIYFPNLRSESAFIETMLKFAEKSEDYYYALQLAQQVENWDFSIESNCIGRYFQGRSKYRMKEYSATIEILNMPKECPKSIRWSSQFYRGLTLMRMKLWSDAVKEFESIGSEFRYNEYKRKAILNARNGKSIRFCSPKKASILAAIIPGSGYFYSKSPKSGLASFCTIGLLSYGAISAFQNQNNGVGVLLSIIGFGWYLGGTYGSGRAALRYNEYLINTYIEPIEIP